MTMTISGSGTITGLSAGGLPSASITQTNMATGVGGTGPAFSAYLPTTAQSVTTATWTKVALSAKDFDTNLNFDTSTYRFTPTVAGYYQISGNIGGNASSTETTIQIAIYKNGASVSVVSIAPTLATFNSCYVGTSKLLYLNGSTDYVELYGYVAASSAPKFDAGGAATFLTGALVRAA
jgi:hypothetical protein